jgi:hypothetical protein
MAPHIVTGETEKSYGVVPSSMVALATASLSLMEGNLTPAFKTRMLAGWSGTFSRIVEPQAGDTENGRPASWNCDKN